MTDDLEKLQYKYLLKRQLRIIDSKESFWVFCKTLAPDFYQETRPHLKELCNVLQSLYEGKLLNPETQKPYKKLMLSLPPRHGKSRTLIMFCSWLLGKDINNKIITCSYNDDQATDFSKYTRDTIAQEKNLAHEIVYKDIFDRVIKRGSSSYQQWALEGSFFNYKGAGIGGSITGKGANVLIVDDPIKSSEEAYNERTLEKIYKWYTGTFLSRAEPGAIEIINMTRWSKRDILGRISQTEDFKNWYQFIKPAYNQKTKKMLCPDLLDLEKYNWLSNPENFDPVIFKANYHQEPIDIEGRLYKYFQTYNYDKLPGKNRVLAVADVADKGNNYFCGGSGVVYKGQIYLRNILYTQDDTEITKYDFPKLLHDSEVELCQIESNAMGNMFANTVKEKLYDLFQNRKCIVKSRPSTTNKEARIKDAAFWIMNNIYFPEDWPQRWPEFYKAVTNYQAKGKNDFDDAPDFLTMFAEMVMTKKNRNVGWV